MKAPPGRARRRLIGDPKTASKDGTSKTVLQKLKDFVFKRYRTNTQKILRNSNPEFLRNSNPAAFPNSTGFIAPLTRTPCLPQPPV
jgi:hypothetical protein